MSTCPICGKRTSFGERCIFKLLQLNNIEFIPQMEFDWLHNKFYDCYIPSNNTIIEINGLQHYQPVKMNSHETPEETLTNTLKSDTLKHDSAISNNINIIYINSSNHNYTAKFSKEFYENTVQALSSLIPNITYEIWIECEKFANYKFIRNECELRNKGLSIEEISKELNEKQNSVIAKLRMGDKYKMCVYDKHTNYKLGRQKSVTKRVS